MTLSEEALYVELGRLIAATPAALNSGPPTSEVYRWLGQAHALVSLVDRDDAEALKVATSGLSPNPASRTGARNTINAVLYRALAPAELEAPAAVCGAFIPAGNTFDAFAAFGKVLGAATKDVLMVDPYMDEKALTDFGVLAPEKVTVRLLADRASHKASLKPAVARWVQQCGTARPLEARITAPRALHDRLLVVDEKQAWVLTQSMNAFALRSPGSIVRVDDETGALKVDGYRDIWNGATILS